MKKVFLILSCCFLATSLLAMEKETACNFCDEWFVPQEVPGKLQALAKMSWLKHLNFFYPADKINSQKLKDTQEFNKVYCVQNGYTSHFYKIKINFLNKIVTTPELSEYYWVFSCLPNLTSLHLFGFKYSKNVSDEVFALCKKLKELKIIDDKGVKLCLRKK